MGYRGLALGTSLTALLNAALQILLIRREIGGVDGRTIAASFGRVSLAAAVMGVAAAAAEWLLRQWLPGESLGLQALRLGWSIALAMVVLFAAAWALRIPELAELRALVVRRVGRRSGE
jgi:putative peptidoglycan lipid II flippase